MSTDTIFAQATVPGRSGVAIIRVSGPAAFLECGHLVGTLPPPRHPALRTVRTAAGATIDEALVLCFARNHSFTGEEVVEFQSHGSIAVVNALLAELSRRPALRPAAPGEFTRRALDNDRLDLTQVEGLADLIDAETEHQRIQAQRVFSGEFSAQVETWRRHLITAAALIEATMDFADEDVPVDVYPDVRDHLGIVLQDLRREVSGFAASERIRDGFEVAIVGPPNVGKSTLLNAIARRPVALTSEIAGTTRDVIELRTDLRGIPVSFLDTAGLRESEDPLESAGVERAVQRAGAADLRVHLLSPGEDSEPFDLDDIVITGKADLHHGSDESRRGVSGLTGEGVEELLCLIGEKLARKVTGGSLAIRDRHRNGILQALGALDAAQGMIESRTEPEVVAESIRAASGALAQLIGRVDVEDLLGDIFSRFCIGK